MQPHANLGIRLRNIRNRALRVERVGSSGGDGIAMGTEMAIKVMLSGIGMAFEHVPFWKRIFRSGRKVSKKRYKGRKA
jgi:hypothetical protein